MNLKVIPAPEGVSINQEGIKAMICTFGNITPKIGDGCYIAPNAMVIGDVVLARGSSVWFNAVVRGDVNSIRIGEETNIQDGSVLHVTSNLFPLSIGSQVTVGHMAVLHGSTVGDRVLIGMGALVLDGAVIGDESVVAAGSVVPEGAVFPPRSLLMGVPAKKVREITDAEVGRILEGCKNYSWATARYLEGACNETGAEGIRP